MKLYYFDLAGRAEPSRIMLRAAGMEFEDLRFDQAKWAADYKAKSPTGQCPFLVLDNGEILCQTVAISVYVANITVFMPSDAVKQARVLEMLAAFDDVRPTCCS
jgi:glutathione S-transferase